MAEARQPQSLLIMSFESWPRERTLEYLDFMAGTGVPIDFAVFDVRKWREPEEGPPLPASIRVHELRPVERALFTQRLKRLVMYRAPRGGLRVLKRAAGSNPVTRPATPVVTLALKAHRRGARLLEKYIFRIYNRASRPHRCVKVADRLLSGAIDFSRVGRVIAADPISVTYAWRLSKRLPHVPVTIELDRTPLPGD